ncbi:MAG: carbon-nitrogen hydrolase [Actinomycetota bacterium]|nr:carbon-nitrogen hydrolase [Actinomycetota bacterium]
MVDTQTGSAVVVACCQLAPTLGDPAANRECVADAVTEAVVSGAQIIVLPELMSSGYMFTDTAEAAASAETVDGETLALWARLAREHAIVIVGGFCELGSDAEVYNSAALLDPDGLRGTYRKAHLWDAERFIFTPGGQAPPVFDTRFGAIAMMICYDLEFPEWVRLPALAGAQLLCAPVNWPAYPRPDGERPAEVVRVQADAGANRMYIAACDRTGPERGAEWVGGSVIVDADGWPLAGGSATTEAITTIAECRLADALDKNIGQHSNVHTDRRPDLYDHFARRG